MPFKDFAAGDILTAADVDDYLMRQTVMTFDDSTARGTALGTAVLTEGMVSYLKDTNTLQYYDGSAWADVSNPGDITAVTAGTALTGGGSSGDVTLDVNIATLATAMAGTAINASGEVLNFDFATAPALTSSGTATYTLSSTDAGKYLQFTAGAMTLTVGSATDFSVGQQVTVLNDGTALSILPEGTGVELYGRGTAAGTAGFLAESQYDAFTILCVGTDAYRIIGNVGAV